MIREASGRVVMIPEAVVQGAWLHLGAADAVPCGVDDVTWVRQRRCE